MMDGNYVVVEDVSMREFIKKYMSKSMVWTIRMCAAMCYLISITAIAQYFQYGGTSIFDGIILLVLALGMHIGRFKICSRMILLMGVIEVAGGLVLYGDMKSTLWLVVGIFCFATFSTVEKHYNAFKSHQYVEAIEEEIK